MFRHHRDLNPVPARKLRVVKSADTTNVYFKIVSASFGIHTKAKMATTYETKNGFTPDDKKD